MCYVYWIHLTEHTDFKTEGYVGVARNPLKRFAKHKTLSKNDRHTNNVLSEQLKKDNCILTLIYEGSESNCYNKEKELRPEYRIGWNICPGGEGGSTTLGKKHDINFRRKRSEFMKNKMPVKDAATGDSIGILDINHPNVLSGLWVHTAKNKKLTALHKERIKISSQGKSKGKKWWNNGLTQTCSKESPGTGWYSGRLTYRGKKVNVAI